LAPEIRDESMSLLKFLAGCPARQSGNARQEFGRKLIERKRSDRKAGRSSSGTARDRARALREKNILRNERECDVSARQRTEDQ